MFLDPRDPAGQAFVAHYLADYPMDDFAEAAIQSGALKCDDCDGLFTSEHDFDEDADRRLCWGCSGECDHSPINAQREWGTW